MRNAAVAALLSTAASYPRIAAWAVHAPRIWALLCVILLAAFFLWSFVFAWHERETGRRVFALATSWKTWGWATAAGVSAAVLLYIFIDPSARKINPLQFPSDVPGWWASVLFVLSFEQLFVCGAPFAFFIRLAHRRDVAGVLTVLFGLLILCLQLSAAEQLSFSTTAIELIAARIAVNSLAIYFYVQGGILLLWWYVLVLNLRHLVDLI